MRYGGHRAAAGLEIERGRLEDFGEAFAAHADGVLRRRSRPVRAERVDAVVAGEELGMELAEELRRSRPSGAPIRRSRCCCAARPSATGGAMGEGRHVRFTVRSGGARARAVAFGIGARLPVEDGEPADATFTLEVNEWRGVSEPRLVLRHAQARAGARLPSRRARRLTRQPRKSSSASPEGRPRGRRRPAARIRFKAAYRVPYP